MNARPPASLCSMAKGEGALSRAAVSSRGGLGPEKTTVATVFWVGEAGGPENGFIANRASAWDEQWMTHYGGVDDPTQRRGYCPKAFVPKENPFYVALPFNDRTESGGRRGGLDALVPWKVPAGSSSGSGSVLKNAWVEVSLGERTCYGQWEDVGPYEQDDADSVFGTAPPANTVDPRAGIDLSPALRDCLGANGMATVRWRFMEPQAIPDGPWCTLPTLR